MGSTLGKAKIAEVAKQEGVLFEIPPFELVDLRELCNSLTLCVINDTAFLELGTPKLVEDVADWELLDAIKSSSVGRLVGVHKQLFQRADEILEVFMEMKDKDLLIIMQDIYSLSSVLVSTQATLPESLRTKVLNFLVSKATKGSTICNIVVMQLLIKLKKTSEEQVRKTLLSLQEEHQVSEKVREKTRVYIPSIIELYPFAEALLVKNDVKVCQ